MQASERPIQSRTLTRLGTGPTSNNLLLCLVQNVGLAAAGNPPRQAFSVVWPQIVLQR